MIVTYVYEREKREGKRVLLKHRIHVCMRERERERERERVLFLTQVASSNECYKPQTLNPKQGALEQRMRRSLLAHYY